MNVYFLVAAILSLAVFLLHTFAGGRVIARPLLASTDLAIVPKLVSYYCWHLVTIVLFVIGTMYGLAALEPSSIDVAWFATILAGAFCAFGLVLPVWNRQSYKNMPQGWLFLPILILGIIGGVT
ncbi:conserved hypothetical protein [Roseibium sp. TrichSKD4]|uniref:hypothetical protein n=1 Tax=Roseibium sp. TrichSKD4 TaxID=744980 RepID=UPI0001E56CC0|nr:hypothetical protein [Roseibium sp. TrichSKD4]EFO32710.1 conserved hypothetical protein [Roseibium sp. TrichSKD4]